MFSNLSTTFLNPLSAIAKDGMKSLAEKMEKIIAESLLGYDRAFCDRKIEIAARFGHLLGMSPPVESSEKVS
jgi:hypothetical protein